MSEAEIHTLKTINTGTSAGANDSQVEDEERRAASPRMIISDTEDSAEGQHEQSQQFLEQPNVIGPTSTPALVSHEEAFANPSLETACQEGNVQLVDQLLTADNLNSGGLHHAAAQNQWRVCNLLISRGADVNCKISPLNATPLLWAARHGHAYIVKLLLDNGADPTVVDSSGFTLLHLAVHSSNVLLVAYVVHLELDVDKPDIGHRTALHWAIVQGDHLSVEVLLKAGASAGLKDGEGALPLHLATYSSQSDLIIALLLQHGADPSSIAIDLASPPRCWSQGCLSSGRQPNGTLPKSRLLSPELAKVITSITPAIVLPIILSLPLLLGSTWLGVVLGLFLAWLTKRCLERFIIPYCWHGEKAVLQSTLLAGIFISIFLWAAYFWFTHIAWFMFAKQPWMTLILVALLVTVVVSYTTTMFLDPGRIEPKSMAVRLKGMNDLINRGLFDSVHLCIHTYVVIPARARYDYYLERVICRYDHYCPWLYNAIGVRNHRAFMLFVISLSTIIPLVGIQYVGLAKEYGSSSFGNGLCILIGLQSIWVYAITIVQLSQIARGATSYETSHLEQLMLYRTDPIKAYSSLPRDHPKSLEILGDTSSASSLLKHNNYHGRNGHGRHHKAPLWMRITGLSQVSDAMNLLRHRMNANETDFGITRNCMDFWCSEGNMLRPSGSLGSLNGKTVDYANISTLPVRRFTESDQILA